MRHHKIQKMLSAFMDGRLSSTEENTIQNHLKDCADCRSMLESFKRLHANTSESVVTVNPFFATRVLADLKSRQREGFWALFDLIPRPIVVTGLALSVIVLAILASPVPRMNDSYAAEYAMFYGESSDITAVTDDQALAIAINAEVVTNGE